MRIASKNAQASIPKPRPEASPAAHHPRPQQTELEGQHGAFTMPIANWTAMSRRPAPCEEQGDGVALAQPAVVHEERDGGQRHAKGTSRMCEARVKAISSPGREGVVGRPREGARLRCSHDLGWFVRDG